MLHKQSIVYGIGAVGLGLTGLVFADFPLQWQPVPEAVPGRTGLALLNALVLTLGGLLILTRSSAIRGAWALALLYGLSVLLLHAPRVVLAPLDIGPWLGLAEILALATAGLMLALILAGGDRPSLMRATLRAFGACPIVFGLSHFAYPDFTAQMVPAWIPARLFWAYATGAAHIAAGLAILTGTLGRLRLGTIAAIAVARLAAVMLTAMLGLFTLLVHLPDVLADPESQGAWTMLFVATSLTGAAWIIGTALSAARPGVRERRGGYRPTTTEAELGSRGT